MKLPVLAAALICATVASADPSTTPLQTPATQPDIVGDPGKDAQYIPPGSWHEEFRREGRKLTIIYTSAKSVNEIIEFNRKELTVNKFRMQECRFEQGMMICPFLGPNIVVGLINIVDQGESRRVMLFAQKMY